jgi:hypothetical protein
MSAVNQLQTLFKSPVVQTFNPYSKAVFSKMAKCHTAAIGMHHYQCSDNLCRHEHLQYHSCGNRHCPNCGCMRKEEWIENRTSELLPTPYYHVVFTLPHEFNPLILGNREKMFKMLFDAAAETLANHSNNPEFLGAESGVTMVLHTWGQNLSFHPHVHCIVTGGGYANGKWLEAKRKNQKFLFPEPSLMKMYKAIFLKKLRKAKALKLEGMDLAKLIKATGFKKWNVYAKAPFGGPAQVVEYLGRYTHKIAITKHRILKIDETNVLFKYKDYADGNKTKEMSLTHAEFLSRFELHILPKRFVKIRHYGFLQNRNKKKRITEIKASLNLEPTKPQVKIPVAQRMLEKFGKDVFKCPCCEKGRLLLVKTIRPYKDYKINVDTRNKASPALN